MRPTSRLSWPFVSRLAAQMNDPLRKRLQEIAATGNDWPLIISALRTECPHSIREVHPAQPGRYNCFAFALGLHQSEKYLEVAARSKPNIFADAAFVSQLIYEGLLRRIDCATPGEKLIIYFRDGAPKHAGVLDGDRVTSKWGDGYFFEHAVYEVPTNYGCETNCYNSPSPSQIEAEFLLYAERQGVQVASLVPRSQRG
jgi:hypothetical protein